MEAREKSNWLRKLRKRKILELLITFAKSAVVGLLFAVICFAYDVYHDSEQDKQLDASIDQLKKIEQSLSTRYLGIFPEYIQEIDVLFSNLDPNDTVVIFEDVLYYGIKSRPNEFRNVNEKLFKHLINGGAVTVAYYDYREAKGGSAIRSIFNKMIIESRISPKYLPALTESRRDTLEQLRELGQFSNDVLRSADSALCEKYFSATRIDNPLKFSKDIEAYIKSNPVSEDWLKSSATPSEVVADQLCLELDSVKRLCLGGKAPEDILFHDYKKMYRMMNEVIAKYYVNYGVDMVPMNEYLTMSCWLVKKGNKGIGSVLAFPSKYSTDEIGFYSQDEAFSRYITTMLEGVKDNQKYRNSN